MSKTSFKPSPERKAKPAKAEKVKRPAKPKTEVVKRPKAEKLPKAEKVKNYKVLENVGDIPPVNEGEKSGAYIQRLLALEEFTPVEIADAVRSQFKGSVAKSSDVSFHRTQLKGKGIYHRTVRLLTDGTRVLNQRKD